MWVLLFDGTFMDGPAATAEILRESSPVMMALFLAFIFLSSFTILNMLIGILCQVVTEVAASEKEHASIAHLKYGLYELLECFDRDDDGMIHRDEFNLLMQNPEFRQALQRFGVSVKDLLILGDSIFEDTSPAIEYNGHLGSLDEEVVEIDSAIHSYSRETRWRKLSFAEFFQVIQRLRGGNNATVTDIVQLRDYMKHRYDGLQSQMMPSERPHSRWKQTTDGQPFEETVLTRLS